METKIKNLRNHFIVCGTGEVAANIADELIKTKREFVVIDNSEKKLQDMKNRLNYEEMLYIAGDPTDDQILLKAGIKEACGVAIACESDAENLFVTMTARELNPDVRIITEGIHPKTSSKLYKAGANSVVSPYVIGGLRMVSEMVRPSVVSFLDIMLRDKKKVIRIEEATIKDGSSLIGQSLREAKIREKVGVNVMALKFEGEEEFIFNPSPDIKLEKNTTLIVMGEIEKVNNLKKICNQL